MRRHPHDPRVQGRRGNDPILMRTGKCDARNMTNFGNTSATPKRLWPHYDAQQRATVWTLKANGWMLGAQRAYVRFRLLLRVASHPRSLANPLPSAQCDAIGAIISRVVFCGSRQNPTDGIDCLAIVQEQARFPPALYPPAIGSHIKNMLSILDTPRVTASTRRCLRGVCSPLDLGEIDVTEGEAGEGLEG
eukprot:12419-Pyramimonas_sp.AAC.1